MTRILLQDMIDGFGFDDLPAIWNSFNLEAFSRNKNLWDYQQEAVKNALKVLWKYYEDFADYQKNEKLDLNQERKKSFYKWYVDNGLDEDLSLRTDNKGNDNLLTEYYSQVGGRIPFEHFVNRMCFWMATGSGKSLVIIKLIQVLNGLIERGEIPPYDIMVLTHRDDLIEQLKKHVEEFNYASEIKINLKELRDYSEVKRQTTLSGITVFYYRSDNLSDVQQTERIDFKNFDNNGKWYIFLDEAHKGDKEESKRQHIYYVLSRNGFLFNSSATFVDPRDIITTTFNFNLEKFINAGYGKHIAILKQEIRAFRDEEDYTNEEKQKIVLKSLILTTYVKKFYDEIQKVKTGLYHKPLLLTLVNSVNTEDADLKLFFREIEKIGKGEIRRDVFAKALSELWDELRQEPEFMFEGGIRVKLDEKTLKSIGLDDILRYIFNSKTGGDIEILVRQSDRKELAFKLKTSDKPFALIKIGDVSGWLKAGWSKKEQGEQRVQEIQERFEDETYFETLNKDDSSINLLMGSRSFYEGWDSNRPNIINYINIGIGDEARKFILQSIGRGVRIEPLKNSRKRLIFLHNNQEIDDALFDKIKDNVSSIETLFIFGTNRKSLVKVVEELDKQKKMEGETQISLTINQECQSRRLLVPTYKVADHPILMAGGQRKFELSEEDRKLLSSFMQLMTDDRVLLMRYKTEPTKIEALRGQISFASNDKSYKDIDLLVQRIFDYFSILPKEFDGLKELSEEIKHFRRIKVCLRDIEEIKSKIKKVEDYPQQLKELQKQYGKISPEEYSKKAENLKREEEFQANNKRIKIKYIANHYYVPLILSEDEKVDYITHIIKTPSEVKFINDLEEYLTKEDNKFKEFDWWMFSKLDPLDEVYIPYYNPKVNGIRSFIPDFIFWLNKGEDYFILFVDPKGTEHTDAERKIDGYRQLFEKEEGEEILPYTNLKVKVKLLLRTTDVSLATEEYRPYWFDNIEKILETI